MAIRNTTDNVPRESTVSKLSISSLILSDDSLITAANKLYFRDTALYINSSADGQLDIDADTELEITAPLVDVNGAVEVSGRLNTELWQFCDDFDEGAAVLASCLHSKAFWTGGGTSGTQAIVAGVNGIMQLDTTATGSRSSTLTFTNANFNTNYAPGLEFRLKQDNITNTKIDFGWYVDGNDKLLFRFDTDVDAANIYLVSENNNGGEVTTDTTVDLVAGTYITCKIQINADETFAAYINGVRVAAAHAGTIRQLATFKPYFYTDNKAAAESKKLDIDYVKIWQNRA